MKDFGKWAAACAAALGLAAAWPVQAAPAPARPKLVVMISVDQFSGSLFDDWRGRFTGGLRRFADGVAYPSGYQSHAATETCPGHSTLLTGKHPNKTGIVGNDVRDPATGKSVYCLYDPGVVLAHGGADPPVGPAQLMATTLGDWLKAANPQSRVVSVSSKDRGAINLGGHSPDAVFWLRPGFGFTTYLKPGADPAQALAPIAEVNARLALQWRQRPQWTLDPACRTPDADWTLAGGLPWRSTVPPVGWGVSDDPAVIARNVSTSPLADAMTLEAAQSLLRRYRLGQGPATDLLAVSFSATDYVGHRYGTRGPEMCDQLRRLDGLVGRLFADLDALGVPYVAVLSADHGGSDLPERLAAQGYPAGRIDGKAVFDAVNAAVRDELRLAAPPLTGSIEEIYIAEPDPSARRRIAEATKRALLTHREIAAAFTLDELLATPIPRGKPADELTLQERFAESAYPGRSADVLLALQPFTTVRAPVIGTELSGHGSVWNYDRRVPIAFWWPGAPSQTRFLPVETVDIAPTLAAVLGLQPPADVDGRCLPLAERGPGACAPANR